MIFRASGESFGIAARGEDDSNKQLHADMEELSQFFGLLLGHGALSGENLGYPAFGTDYGPEILGR
ncbi:MAG: hypothetical protein ABSH24_17965 [Bryobacteraceae bacterium]